MFADINGFRIPSSGRTRGLFSRLSFARPSTKRNGNGNGNGNGSKRYMRASWAGDQSGNAWFDRARAPYFDVRSGLSGLGDDNTDATTNPGILDTTTSFLRNLSQTLPALAQSYAQVRTAGAQAVQIANAPYTPVQRTVNSVSRFSSNNTKWLLFAAGGLGLALIVPRLMRR